MATKEEDDDDGGQVPAAPVAGDPSTPAKGDEETPRKTGRPKDPNSRRSKAERRAAARSEATRIADKTDAVTLGKVPNPKAPTVAKPPAKEEEKPAEDADKPLPEPDPQLVARLTPACAMVMNGMIGMVRARRGLKPPPENVSKHLGAEGAYLLCQYVPEDWTKHARLGMFAFAVIAAIQAPDEELAAVAGEQPAKTATAANG